MPAVPGLPVMAVGVARMHASFMGGGAVYTIEECLSICLACRRWRLAVWHACIIDGAVRIERRVDDD